jgi:hypothetical protein
MGRHRACFKFDGSWCRSQHRPSCVDLWVSTYESWPVEPTPRSATVPAPSPQSLSPTPATEDAEGLFSLVIWRHSSRDLTLEDSVERRCLGDRILLPLLRTTHTLLTMEGPAHSSVARAGLSQTCPSRRYSLEATNFKRQKKEQQGTRNKRFNQLLSLFTLRYTPERTVLLYTSTLEPA